MVLKQIADYFRHLLILSEETRRNTLVTDRLQEQVKLLTIEVEKLRIELHGVREREDSEREKLLLRLENRFLRFERGLKSGDDAD